MPLYKADRRVWLTADRSRLVEDGDSEAAFLFLHVGQEISVAEAAKYGLIKATEKPDDKSMPAPANKGVRGKA